MKKWIICILSALMCFSAVALTGCGTKADYNVSVIQYVEHGALDLATKGFKDELTAKMKAVDKTVKFKSKSCAANADMVLSTATTYAASNCDLIMANATPAATTMAANCDDKPILFTSVTDAEVARLVTSNTAPGKNVSGTSDLGPIKDQILLMQDLIDGLNKVAFLYTTSEENSVAQLNMFKAECTKLGITVAEKPITDGNDIVSVFGAIKNDTSIQAIYIPTDNVLANLADDVHTANMDSAKLPIICGEINMNDGCGIATYGVDYYELGKQTGAMAFRILYEGADISKMPVEYQAAANTKFSVNTYIAEKLNFTIKQSIKDKADVTYTGPNA